MHKCDSCGKVVVNEQDYMCPHCGAVSNKHCDHATHLPDDKYFRANDYRTAAEEHKSKTYDYEKAPKMDANQKFDINDLANIKNADDVKKVAKKAFIEQDKNGRKKFKPVAIVLIVIFAVNIFCNLLSVGFDAIDGFFEEIASELPDEWVGYELGEETITHYFSVDTYIKDGAYDKENDCLKFNLSELFFAHNDSVDEDYDTVTEEWQSEFTSPKERFYSEQIVVNAVFFSPKDIVDAEKIENSYKNDVELYGEITSDGVLYIYGVNQHLKKYDAQSGYMELATVSLRTENAETKEHFDFYFSIPFNFVKVNSDGTLKYFYIYSYDDEVTNTEVDLNDQYYPDVEELEEYDEFIDFSDSNIVESVPASVTYTENVVELN
jgi:predicted  nucleic acid-binding Zn-ribbon protein